MLTSLFIRLIDFTLLPRPIYLSFILVTMVFHSFSNNRGFNLFAIRSSLFKPRGRVKICKKLSRFVTVVRHFCPDVQVQFARPLQPGQVKFNVFAIFWQNWKNRQNKRLLSSIAPYYPPFGPPQNWFPKFECMSRMGLIIQSKADFIA